MLERHLGEAVCGDGFVLMGGDCAETFQDFSVNGTRDDFLLLLRMSLIIGYASGVPVTPIGRMAGQFAKPRSVLWDKQNVRSYQGDMINGVEITDREPDPVRMIDAYHQSVQSMNLIRAFRNGGVDNLPFLHELNRRDLDGITTGMHPDVRARYTRHLDVMDQTIRFIQSTTRSTPSIGRFYTGHECLLLPYEACLTRADSTTTMSSEEWYDTSAHFLWLGERTRKINASQVEFLRGIHNPIGIKVSGTTDIQELQEIVKILNPHRKIGKVTIISRMGPEVVPLKLPKIIDALQDEPVLWVCDPMHATTFSIGAQKTRSLHTIHREIESFFHVLHRKGLRPHGVHLEMTSSNVTECIGGVIDPVSPSDLGSDRYKSLCDPRLNGAQSLETAFLIADLVQKYNHRTVF